MSQNDVISSDQLSLKQENQINVFLNETNTINLSTSSQKLDEFFNRKRKTKEERQITLKKKFDSIKISTLVLFIDETLKNAQKTLFEDLKVTQSKHVIVQHLISQIERARINLDLTDDVSVTINQMQTDKNFEFASIDMIKKSSTTSSSYSERMSENFQQLEKTIEQKMTKLITERVENKSIQKRSVLETSKKSDSLNHAKSWNSKETSQASRKILTTRTSQTSSKSYTNNHTNLTSSSSSFIWAKVVNKNTTKVAKAQTAKLNETIQWKSRHMIVFSKNFVNAINSTESRDRMNKRIRNKKNDILITIINSLRT